MFITLPFMNGAEPFVLRRTILYHSHENRSKQILYIRPPFLNVGPPKESIFLTTIYGLYFSHHYTHDKLHFLHDIDLLWAAFILVQLVHKPIQ